MNRVTLLSPLCFRRLLSGARLLPLLLVAGLAANSVSAEPPHSPATTSHHWVDEEANRWLVIKFYDQFFNQHQLQAADVIVNNYKQHNPDLPDGKQPFVDYFAQFFREHPESSARIVRSATDRDLVYLHVHSHTEANDRGQAVVDIFRVRGGKIVEHWDVIQDVPAESANPNTMF